MTGASPAIAGSWSHSFEEDTATSSVYRPDDYPFPLTRRVRDGLEFRADGTFVEHRGGPDDRRHATVGRWQAGAADRVEITFPQDRRAPFDIVVLSCTDDRLVIAPR